MPRTFLLLTLALLTTPYSSQISSECFTYFRPDHIAFDMRPLQSQKMERLKSIITVDGIFIDGFIVYDFCRPLDLTGLICEANFQNSHAYFITEDAKLCINLLSSHSSQNSYSFLDHSTLETKLSGFKVFRKKPDFEFNFVCANDVKNEPRISVRNNSFTVSTAFACGEVNAKAQLLKRLRILISIIMFILGFVFALFGYFKVVFLRHLILGVIMVVITFSLLTQLIFPPKTYFQNLIFAGFSLLIGFIFLKLKIRNEVFSGTLLAFAVGCILGHQGVHLLGVRATDVSLLACHYRHSHRLWSALGLRWGRVQGPCVPGHELLPGLVHVHLRNGIFPAIAGK